MATLDLSDAFDSSFIDDIVVKRRVEVVNTYGEVVISETDIAAWAVVTAGSDNDLVREPDAQNLGKSIMVVTQFRLRGSAPGYQPDLVNWHGSDFVVTTVEDYSGFGAGWIQAACISIDFVDPAP